VSDLDAAVAWYRDVLGLPLLFSFPTVAFFDCGGVRLMLARHDQAGTESLLYFKVSDLRQTCATLAARGVRFVQDAQRVHTHEDGSEEWMAFFNDPEGRPLALMARQAPGSA
ncbi:MAG: VOC family protein, partial [Xanthomonadales bacterium]|nr:VOC family protein [Xanthomonadales bacterium]